MTIETVPNSDLQYFLISFNRDGSERKDDPDSSSGCLSNDLETEMINEPVTDVFLISHGWKGDIPAAKDQYDRWISAMLACQDDLGQIRKSDPTFKPLIVGLHWPSLPWGNEEQESEVSFSVPGAIAPTLDEIIKSASQELCDSDKARTALRTIFESALEDIEPPSLPSKVVDAYQILFDELDLGTDGPAGAPGEDADGFDAEESYQSSRNFAMIEFGDSPIAGGLLSPLRQLSFWKMKKRARKFGESGARDLLHRLQLVANKSRPVRFHLMGHSFGCIVISSCIAGANGDSPILRPVNSAFLVQGALSIWAYCNDIPVASGRSGYFSSIIRDNKVNGPLITTQSDHDTAVGKLYPLAAGIKRQVQYAINDPPKYAAIGAFGIRGPGVDIVDLEMLPREESYAFVQNRVYNIESSAYICDGSGASGAHSDICKPEVSHAFLQGILASLN